MLNRFTKKQRAPASSFAAERQALLQYRQPISFVFLRMLLTATVIACAGLALYSAYWFVAAAHLKSVVADWAEARRAEGMTVAYKDGGVEGYPTRLRLIFNKPVLADPGAREPWSWQGPRLTAELKPWWWKRVRISAPGKHEASVTLPNRSATYRGAIERLVLEIAFAGGRAREAALDLAGLDMREANPGHGLTVTRARITATDRQGKTPDYSAPAFVLHIDAAGMRVPADFVLPLGNDIREIGVDGTLTGEIPLNPWPGALTRWRDRGGVAEFRRLDVAYGPLTVRTNGTVSLDAALQPVAAFTAKVQGFIETVDAFRKLGLINGRDAITAKLVLGALAKPPKEGGPSAVSLPLTLQNRKIFAGPVHLATMPKIRWGGGPKIRWDGGPEIRAGGGPEIRAGGGPAP